MLKNVLRVEGKKPNDVYDVFNSNDNDSCRSV